jgi:signal peptidase I
MLGLNRISIALLAVLITTLLIQPYRPVIVRGRSMTPTFQDGQVLFASRPDRKLEKGDVVLFTHDGDTLIKRVARVPGDRYIEAYVPMMHRWTEIAGPAMRDLVRRGVFACRVSTVPADRIYVLGDNPDVSLDSRAFGMVPIGSVKAIIPDS